jgi:hypothetical protein
MLPISSSIWAQVRLSTPMAQLNRHILSAISVKLCITNRSPPTEDHKTVTGHQSSKPPLHNFSNDTRAPTGARMASTAQETILTETMGIGVAILRINIPCVMPCILIAASGSMVVTLAPVWGNKNGLVQGWKYDNLSRVEERWLNRMNFCLGWAGFWLGNA